MKSQHLCYPPELMHVCLSMCVWVCEFCEACVHIVYVCVRAVESYPQLEAKTDII